MNNDEIKKSEELKDEQLQKSQELSDEELDQIAGGAGWFVPNPGSPM